MKVKKTNQSKASYSADRPISSKKDDILGRAKFAFCLSDDIHSWKGNDSLVIALYGAWGSGKTSVKNMLLESNRKRGQAQLPVVDFNPWQLSGTGNIPTAFFRELGLAIKEEGPKKDVERRTKKWNAYAATLMVAGTTAELVGKAMPLAGIPGGPIIKNFGNGMKSAGASIKEGSEALRANNETIVKSLQDQKRELADLFMKLPHPLLVVIDDIDRLTTDEILQVFQLVKANADFPRLIYLLLFEREVVAEALNHISGDRGMEYLEKIIQVGYHIPYASDIAVQTVLFAGINKLMNESSASKHWDKNRWADLYIDGVAGYFKNLRHVYRFLASFDFHFRQHHNQTSFEVNPIDLVGLEVLRVFEPAIYERLPRAKTILTRYEGPKMFGKIKQEIIDQAVSQIVSVAAVQNQSRVRKVLEILFPPLSSSYSGQFEVLTHHHEWMRSLRICHPSLFDKYFALTIGNDDLSQAELENLLMLTSDVEKFSIACNALEKRNLLKLAFQRLEVHKEYIPLQNMPALIESLCNLGDRFSAKRLAFSEIDIGTLAGRLVYFGLHKEPNSKRRFEVLRDALRRSLGIALPLRIVSLQERVAGREASGYNFLVDEEDLPELKRICIGKLHAASQTTGFLQSPNLVEFLFRWSEWTSLEEVRGWIVDHSDSPMGAVWLLTVLMGEMHSWGQEHRIRYYIQLSVVERFSDIERLKKLIEQIKIADLSKKEARAIQEFNNALKRRAEGKSDDAWKNMDEDYVEEVLE